MRIFSQWWHEIPVYSYKRGYVCKSGENIASCGRIAAPVVIADVEPYAFHTDDLCGKGRQ